MKKDELARWAKIHHYPQLVLGCKDVVRHGEASWQQLLKGHKGRIQKAIKRVEMWEKRLEKAS